MDTEILRYRDTGIKECSDTRIKAYKCMDIWIQIYKDIQGYRNTEIIDSVEHNIIEYDEQD